MMTELLESEWWDEGETIILYHGTSSHLIDQIQTDGLTPPQLSVRKYAYEILSHYVPQSQWTKKLIKLVDEHAVRDGAGRHGERGAVLFFFTDLEGAKGYAEAYAEDGGEIARDVRTCVGIASHGHLTMKDFDLDQIVPPRFKGGEAAVVQVEVPKSWCLFDLDLKRLKTNYQAAWEEGRNWTREFASLEDLYRGVFKRREVRVPRTIPPSMIKAVIR